MKRILSLLVVFLLSLSCMSEEMFFSMPNPWTETTSEEMALVTGLSFAVPENAENITYFMNEGLSLAEMRFDLNGVSYTARIQPANAFTDISGLYYNLTLCAEAAIGASEAKIFTCPAENETVFLCLWYDAAPGLMYSVSCRSKAPVDILSVSESVYFPHQGECGGDTDIDPYTELLIGLTGYTGTAGASMKEAIAAKNALDFAIRHPVSDENIQSVREDILSAFDALDEARREEFLSDLPSLNRIIENAVRDFDAVSGLFEDAGVYEEMLLLLENENAYTLWQEFFAAFVVLYTPVG